MNIMMPFGPFNFQVLKWYACSTRAHTQNVFSLLSAVLEFFKRESPDPPPPPPHTHTQALKMYERSLQLFTHSYIFMGNRYYIYTDSF